MSQAPPTIRAAFLPALTIIGLLAWAMTGLTLVQPDERAVYERFGAPVSVLHSGLHAGLPWPFGTTHRLEDGAIHDIGLGPRPGAPLTEAEDSALVMGQRETARPGDITLVTAGETSTLQALGADLRVLYRTGLTDEDARQAAYSTAEPEALVRALTGNIVVHYFAAHTLNGLLGADRDAMGRALRTRLQAALDQHATGLEAVGIVIEAVHPSADDTAATQEISAAEIAVRTSVAVAHGAAATIAAQARQAAYDMTSSAHAAAAENVSLARADLIRFAADRQAARVGGQSFLLERYFTALSTALARAPKTIIDHRLNWPEAPVLDLRPYAAAAGGTGKEE